MRTGIALLAACLLLVPAAAAEESATAAGVTEPGRSLDRALNVVLGGRGSAEPAKRTLYFLVDPTPSLAGARFQDALADALARKKARLANARIGVATIGTKTRLAPTDDPALVVQAVAAALAAPTSAFQNVYAELRTLTGALSGKAGEREICLVSLDNGDAEDDVEGTLAALRRSDVKLSVITQEAFLADSYYVRYSTLAAPRGTKLQAGGDAAFVEVPWGWLMQLSSGSDSVPSGFGLYGLTRLAAGSGGRLFLYAPPSGEHRCCTYGVCPFCSGTGDHAPPGEAYQSHRLQALAPLAGRRSRVFAAAARDPYFRATLSLWSKASKERLLYSRPSVKPAGGSLKPERRQLGTLATVMTGLNFRSTAGKADKLVRTCDRLIAEYEADLARLEGSGAPATRYRAIAELTRVKLHLTRLNLIALRMWCEEAGPHLLPGGEPPLPPEVEMYRADSDYISIAYTNMCLCHGVKPYLGLHLPGGEAFKQELAAFDRVFSEFLTRYAHTPFAVAARRAGIARFTFGVRAKPAPPPPRERSGSDKDKPTTETGRPNRPGSGVTGSGGATTGGG